MRSAFQEELFGTEQYTRLCSICRGGFPRSLEFFPEGRCQDMMASYCRKCANVRVQPQHSSKENKKEISTLYSLEKSCKVCGDIKKLREFYMSSKSHDGKTSACKNCTDEKHKEREIRQQQQAELGWAVYFIKDSRNNRVKIGSSDDSQLALASLQEGSSETLHLIANHESGEKDTAEMIANVLHCLFQTHHTGNSWFEMAPSLEHYISLIQHGDFEKAEILLYPIESTENISSSKLIQKESIESVVEVDGQSFPSILAASSATGYTAEQLKKYLQNSSKSTSPLGPKLQKAG